MKFKKIFLGAAAFASAFLFAVNVHAARTDMIDVASYNNNGNVISTSQFQSIRNQYGVKAVTAKLSEGTTYRWNGAAQTIANAKAAGLYTNGYHYARYATTQKAQAEAETAINTARADGLSVGSVIAADVEASEQKAVTLNQNNADNAVFEAAIQKAGYRYDLYTMASWIGTKMSMPSGSGWVAYYPYHVTKDDYSDHHAWQFSSKQIFNGLAGYFDVSQLYDNYYTAGQDKNAVISNDNTTNVTTVANNSKAKMSAQGQAGSSQLAVDGYLGYRTILKSQQVYDMRYQDGVLSSPRSSMVLIWQRHLGVKADGILGPQTINAMERRAGLCGTDGHLSSPSYTVKYMQQKLNAGQKPF